MHLSDLGPNDAESTQARKNLLGRRRQSKAGLSPPAGRAQACESLILLRASPVFKPTQPVLLDPPSSTITTMLLGIFQLFSFRKFVILPSLGFFFGLARVVMSSI